MNNILFYGDSNTWGFNPANGQRYPYELRWTTICAGLLGEDCCCIPEGMNGRMTAFDDPVKGCRNGLKGLDYALQSNKPLDLLVLMLGTNDLKFTNAEGSAEGLKKLVRKIVSANERFSLSSPVFPEGAKILVISPVLLYSNICETGEYDACAESEKLSALYERIAEEEQLEFLDASAFAEPSAVDGVHLGPEGHQKLAHSVAEKIVQCLGR